MSTSRRATLNTIVMAGAVHSFTASAAASAPLQPVPGITVDDCLGGSSSLLECCVHLTKLIHDGNPEDAETSAYCLGFLLEGAKALLDSAHSQLERGAK